MINVDEIRKSIQIDSFRSQEVPLATEYRSSFSLNSAAVLSDNLVDVNFNVGAFFTDQAVKSVKERMYGDTLRALFELRSELQKMPREARPASLLLDKLIKELDS